MIKYRGKIILKYFIGLSIILSYANAETEVEKSIKNQILFEKQKEQFKKMEKSSNEKILYYDTKKPEIQEEKSGKCIEIQKIQENSITLLSEDEKQTIFQKYEQTCRTLPELNNLRKELMQLYIDKGYVTSQVYLKAQKMDDGILELHAIEGKISKITPQDMYIKNAFLGQENEFLNLRDLEDSVETINKLESNHATMKLIPGETAGTTNIEIDNNVTNRVHGTIGIDNFGDKTTGRAQGNLELNIDSPLGLNDQFNIFINTTNKHSAMQNSKGSGYQYSLPIGAKLTTSFRYRKSNYKKLVNAGIADLEFRGNTSTYTFNLGYKLFHNQNSRIGMGAFVSHYKSENYISDALIEVSSYNLSKAGISVDYLYQMPGFYSFLSFSYTKGNKWFGVHNPTELDDRFSLYTMDLSLMKQFSYFSYTLNAHYQHTNYQLFSTDQISIGGPYSVRGYKEEGLSGNTGYYARNELSKSLESKFLDLFDQTYFIAFDSGWIKKEEDVDFGKLLSYSLGAKYEKGNFSTQVYYAIPIHHRDVSQTSKFFGISMNYRY